MKNYSKQFLALLSVILFPSNIAWCMEIQGDEPEEFNEEWHTMSGDYAAMREVLHEAFHKNPELKHVIESDDIDLLRAVDDNDQEFVKKYIDRIKITAYDPIHKKIISYKIADLKNRNILLLARKIALKNRNYTLAKIIEQEL